MNRYQDLLDRMDSYEAGRLVVDNDEILKLQRTVDNKIVNIHRDSEIEVFDGNRFEKYSYETLLTTKTIDGFPGYAGLYTRVK